MEDGDACKITLMYRGDLTADSTPRAPSPPDADPASRAPRPRDTDPTAGAVLIWFTFPGKPYEIASVWEANGRLRGYYTNVVRPPDLSDSAAWHITDLFLDVWQPRDRKPEILDEE
ncbi:MAG: DUF402 domain-containing protein, partial [Gemmatimonadota bacterium]